MAIIPFFRIRDTNYPNSELQKKRIHVSNENYLVGSSFCLAHKDIIKMKNDTTENT